MLGASRSLSDRQRVLRVEHPDYEQWICRSVNSDGSARIARPAWPEAQYLDAPVRGGVSPEPGSSVLVSFQDAKRNRPQVVALSTIVGRGNTPQARLYLSGLWVQWEGSPELLLRSNTVGPRWSPGAGVLVANQAEFSGPLNSPMWSSPVLWPASSGGNNLAQLLISADSPGSTLGLWLQIWEPTGTPPALRMLRATRLATYSPIGGHGTALDLSGTYDWGAEFISSRLHYLPSTGQILVLGPAWDPVGRHDVFLCSSSGALLSRSVLPGRQVGASVAPYAIVTGLWATHKSVDGLTGTLSESEELTDGRLIRGYRANGSVYAQAWTIDPMEQIPTSTGISILQPVTTRPSGRNDRRWPYCTKTNTIAVMISSGIGLVGDAMQELNFAYPSIEIQDVNLFAGFKTGAYSFASMVWLFVDAETGVIQHFDFDFVNGYNNREVESDTLGLGAANGLPDEGIQQTFETICGLYPDDPPGADPTCLDFLTEQSNTVRESLELQDYHAMGSLPLTFPLASHNDQVGWSACQWGAGGVATLPRPAYGPNTPIYYGRFYGGSTGGFVNESPAGWVPGYNVSGSSGTSQSANTLSGCYDRDGSHYAEYAMPWIYPRGGADCSTYKNGHTFMPYTIPFVGYNNEVRNGVAYDRMVCAKVDQHYRTYLRKIPKNQSANGWLASITQEVGQKFSVTLPTSGPHGSATLNLQHQRPCLEQCWAMVPVASSSSPRIQGLVLRLVDRRVSLSLESRPVLHVLDSDTLAELGVIELCQTDIANADDADTDANPNTIAVEGQYIYDSRALTPAMRCQIATSAPGKYGEGCAAATIWLYVRDRINSLDPLSLRVVSVLFEGEYPGVPPVVTVTTVPDYTGDPGTDLPHDTQSFAQDGSTAYWGPGNVFASI